MTRTRATALALVAILSAGACGAAHAQGRGLGGGLLGAGIGGAIGGTGGALAGAAEGSNPAITLRPRPTARLVMVIRIPVGTLLSLQCHVARRSDEPAITEDGDHSFRR